MGLLKEFKDFAMRGNVIDLAVGVIIAGAFGKIVDGLVKNIFMPIIALTGGVKVDDLWDVKGIKFGAFTQTVIDFLLVAICLFVVIKVLNTVQKKGKTEEAAAPPPPPEDIVLLREIRDSLAKSSPRRAD
jgi:large conductance mechanosensitive channel